MWMQNVPFVEDNFRTDMDGLYLEGNLGPLFLVGLAAVGYGSLWRLKNDVEQIWRANSR